MEATKKVGVPDPSGPQGHPLPGSQQLRGSFRESQGPWMSSRPLYSKQGLSLSTGAIADMACSSTSQDPPSQPSHQPLQDSAQVSSQYAQASQDPSRFSSSNPLPNATVGTQEHLLMDDGTQTLPLCTHNDSTNDKAQYGFNFSQIQLQIGRESKTPAKVLVGWGKGTCSIGQVASVGPRKSRWLPYLLPGESGAVQSQNSLQTLAQVPDQDQGQGKGPAQAPTLNKTTSSTSLPLPTSTQASTPAVNAPPTPAAVEPYTSGPDQLTNTPVATKDQPLDLKNGSNQLTILLDSSKNENVYFTPVTPAPTLEEFSAPTQKQEVAKMQVPPKQSEDPVNTSLVHASRLDTSTPAAETVAVLKTQISSHKICSSQPDKQPPSACNNNCSSVPLPACQGAYNKQSPAQTPRETMQIPISSAPTCQLQDAVEDHVLVFDMATGNTRMGLLCHDPMGSRAVLVGLTPNHPSTRISENMLSARPLPRPVLSPNSDHPSMWSTTAMLSSPVPSSLSAGSYPEVALVSKEAKHNLESQHFPGTETPLRTGMFARPLVPGTPLQCDEKTPAQVPDDNWSKSEAEKVDPGHTIWMLDSPRMQDSSTVQTRKLQWIEPDSVSTDNNQRVPRLPLQEEVGSKNQKEVSSAQPSGPQTECTGQAFPTGQNFLNEQNLLARQLPVAEQGSLSGQLSSTKQPPLTSPPHLSEQTPISRQVSLNRQVPLTVKFPTTKEPTFTSGESAQPSTQESEPLGNPTHVGILRLPLASEEACICVNRDKAVNNSVQRSTIHPLPSWQPSDPHRAHQEQLSLITFTGCKDLPITMVGTESQSGHQYKLTAEDITHSSVVTHLGLLHGNCYELVSTMGALPVRSPVLCHHSSSPYQNMAAIVIDTGTGFTKCGLAGEDHVLNVVPSQVQMMQHPAQGQPQYVVPEHQEGSYSVLNRGVVSDWDALEVLWQHLFYCKLRVQPEEMAVLVADSPISPRTNREKVAEILFERFRVPAMQTVHQALLTLYAYGRTTGLVVGSGHGTSYVAPILTGDLAPLNTYRLDVAGADLTDYMAQLLLAAGHSAPKAELVRQIKEACCYVAMDMAAEMARNQSQGQVDFVLPDKQVITLGSERFCCPEALFQPNLLGINQPGLPQLALLSISRLEAKQQEQLLANVVLEGGSTLVNGFPERLRQELGPSAMVLGSPHRAVASWLGGSIMACRDSFRSLWLSRREYEEEGPWAIYKYQL
ncbi:mucin-17 [Phodopus roborovskii]|uniref:Actl11 protein n=1 Tax=Phodopus roborovskii TaxID=109678 RepID=A0AAU9YRU1_PHORO|nr:mucin-17 [Phodopus roborovskii]CAH6777728.1 Actl11 [Phodopus roborovskii]